MNAERNRKLHARLRPLVWMETLIGLASIAALIIGPKNTANPWFLGLMCLGALMNAVRNVALYQQMDEYERSLMLRAVAAAFIFLMVSLFITALMGAFSPAETVSTLLLMLLFLAAHVVLGVTHTILQRREAQE